MPIVGLSDRTRRLPRLGKIRLGIKVEGQKGTYPKAVDYFVCPPEVQAVFGEQPREIEIVLPNDFPEQFAAHFYRCYSSSRGQVCKGDGVVAHRDVDMEKAIDRATGEIPGGQHPRLWPVASHTSKRVERREVACLPLAHKGDGDRDEDCPEDCCPEFWRKQCRPIMNFQFMIPQVPGIGVWQIDTSSWNSMRNILDGIELIRGISEQVLGKPRLHMIPVTLALKPQEVQPEGQPKKKVHTLHLIPPYKLAELISGLQLPAAHGFLLPAGDTEPPDDLYPPELLEQAEGESPNEEPEAAPGQADEPEGPFAPQPEDPRRLLWGECMDLIRELKVTNQQLADWWSKRGIQPETLATEYTAEMSLSVDQVTEFLLALRSSQEHRARKAQAAMP